MPDGPVPDDETETGDIMAGERRIARADSALPDWYIADGAYRPIPIAWFAAALILQVIVQPLLAAMLMGGGLPRLAVLATTLIASGLIWRMTWKLGMSRASTAWKGATVLMLGFFQGITALGLFA